MVNKEYSVTGLLFKHPRKLQKSLDPFQYKEKNVCPNSSGCFKSVQ